MKLEDQVCSLELAMRLKKLGVKQESFSAWYDGSLTFMKRPYVWISRTYYPSEAPPGDIELFAAAFTVAELGEMLPTKKENWQNAQLDDGRWFINNYVATFPTSIADNEADARAKMLIYLIEKKLITV